MKYFYSILAVAISLLASIVIHVISKDILIDGYWINTGWLCFVIGVCSYYRFKEYEKNKGV